MEALIDGLLFVAVTVAVAGVAARLGVAAPILLVLGGIALSFVPGLPKLRLHPDLVLVLVLPPLLYAAAVSTSVPAFRENLRSIGLLAIGLTLFTTLTVGLVAAAVIPGLPLAAAFALGAIVAPPDAVAATSIARRAGLPRRLVTVLEGESLINDAVALVAYRVTVAAAVTGVSASLPLVAVDFVVASAGGLAVGYAVARLLALVRGWVENELMDNALALLTPFLAYLPAEAIDASGVLAVVVAGLYLGHREPTLMSPTSRLVSRSLWRMIEFLLQGVVFILIGFQLPDVVQGLSTHAAGTLVTATLAVLLTVIASRFAWVFPATYLARLFQRGRRQDQGAAWQVPTVISWAGLRGVVSMAAAFALPLTLDDGSPFPHRDLLLFITFMVILVTLVVQGLTLPGLIRRLALPRPDPVDDALREAEAQQAAADAALARLEELIAEDPPPPGVAEALRQAVEYRRLSAWERLGAERTGPERYVTPSAAYRRLGQAMLQAERDEFVRRRDLGQLDEDILNQVNLRLDLEESALNRDVDHVKGRESVRAGIRGDGRGARRSGCAHLERARDVEPSTPDGCTDCLRLGTHWVHLRLCLVCGNVGCCDSSPERHATAHFNATGHPVIRSFEPGEGWRWCYVDQLLV